ncbi:hypothetical protein GCM10027427_35210 [Pseudoclavibacter terrae]
MHIAANLEPATKNSPSKPDATTAYGLAAPATLGKNDVAAAARGKHPPRAPPPN